MLRGNENEWIFEQEGGMNLSDVFGKLELEGSYEEQCKQYAEMLDTGIVLGMFPEELIGDEISSDGKWSWSKKTAFINKYKNNTDFNDVTCILKDPLPEGCFIINKHFDNSSSQERDRILARIAKKKFVDVRVNYERHKILLAKEVSRKQVDREISQLIIRSGIEYFKPFLDMYEAEDGKTVVSRTRCSILAWLKFYKNFIEGDYDEQKKEDIFIILTYSLGIPADEANWFIEEWEEDRDILKMEQMMNSEESNEPLSIRN